MCVHNVVPCGHHVATLLELIRVKPTMSAKRMLTLSMLLMLKRRNTIVRRSVESRGGGIWGVRGVGEGELDGWLIGGVRWVGDWGS